MPVGQDEPKLPVGQQHPSLHPRRQGARQARAGEGGSPQGRPERQRAALPAQTLSELSNVCLRKLEPALKSREVRREVERLYAAFPVVPLTAPVVMEALRGVEEYRFSYYDAQIWAAARLAQVPVVLSEDFNPGATLEGVSFVNPLDPDFDPTALDGG